MKKNFCLVLLISVLLLNIFVLASCGILQNDIKLSDKDCGVLMCNEILSEKLNDKFSADIIKEIYDFTGEFNYLLCYDKSLDYYAIYNMDSGKIMERSEGNVFDGYLDYKCFYAGLNMYFYEKENIIYDISNNDNLDSRTAMEKLKDYSLEIMNSSIEDSQFKDREAIKKYIFEKKKTEDETITTNCGSSNRSRAKYSNNLDYNMNVLCNSRYCGPVENKSFCYMDGLCIGFREFNTYDSNVFCDTIFPINQEGSCGIVAATMLLQYYDRNRILKTIPDRLYNFCYYNFQHKGSYNTSSSASISEILHETLNSHHKEVAGGSTYVSVENAINSYIKSSDQLSGFRATSSASWWGLKSAIDNGDPCIIFFGGNMHVLNNDLNSYSKESVSGHAVYTYGYTLSSLNIVDEYICHAGWRETSHYYGKVFVAKTLIAGNVRLQY